MYQKTLVFVYKLKRQYFPNFHFHTILVVCGQTEAEILPKLSFPHSYSRGHGTKATSAVGALMDRAVIHAVRQTAAVVIGTQPNLDHNPLFERRVGRTGIANRGDFTATFESITYVCDTTFAAQISNSETCGFNANQANQLKHKKYENEFIFNHELLISLGFEAYGAWSSEAESFFKRLLSGTKNFTLMNKIAGIIGRGRLRANTRYLHASRFFSVPVHDKLKKKEKKETFLSTQL